MAENFKLTLIAVIFPGGRREENDYAGGGEVQFFIEFAKFLNIL